MCRGRCRGRCKNIGGMRCLCFEKGISKTEPFSSRNASRPIFYNVPYTVPYRFPTRPLHVPYVPYKHPRFNTCANNASSPTLVTVSGTIFRTLAMPQASFRPSPPKETLPSRPTPATRQSTSIDWLAQPTHPSLQLSTCDETPPLSLGDATSILADGITFGLDDGCHASWHRGHRLHNQGSW